jgi:hypothetical protein
VNSSDGDQMHINSGHRDGPPTIDALVDSDDAPAAPTLE